MKRGLSPGQGAPAKETNNGRGAKKGKNRKAVFNAKGKCPECRQLLKDVVREEELNQLQWSDELEMLTNPKLLSLYEEESKDCPPTESSGPNLDEDDRPQHKVTSFSVYDSKGHLVPFDGGLIEEGKEIFLSGWIKPVYDEDQTVANGLPSKGLGPLTEWWFSGFDGGDNLLVGVETVYASYILVKPSERYKPIMDMMSAKLHVTKLTIELVGKDPDANYEDLVEAITSRSNGKYNEESLLRYGDFIVQQIISYDEAGDETDIPLLETPCIQNFLALGGINELTTRLDEHQFKPIARKDSRRNCNSDTLTTSTLLVRQFFENVFKGAIKRDAGDKLGKQPARPSVGAIKKRANDSKATPNISWTGDIVDADELNRKNYYSQVKVDHQTYLVGDFVAVTSEKEGSSRFGRIVSLFESPNRQKSMHLHSFCHGSNTVLGETSHPQYLFMQLQCQDVSLTSILQKVKVSLGPNTENDLDVNAKDSYFCHKLYFSQTARFEDLPVESLIPYRCFNCFYREEETTKQMLELGVPINEPEAVEFQYSWFKWKSMRYEVNDCVLLQSDAYDLPDVLEQTVRASHGAPRDKDDDEDLYPEKYRKRFSDYVKGSMKDVSRPYLVAKIEAISVASLNKETAENNNVMITVRKFLRPQNVLKKWENILGAGLRELYFSNDIVSVKHTKLVGKCDIYHVTEGTDLDERFCGFNQPVFYFRQMYDRNTNQFDTPTEDIASGFKCPASDEPSEGRRLRTLDLFSGCGGLALGFEESGVCQTLWAIEKEKTAANSFRVNFPEATVFEEDANKILSLVMDNIGLAFDGQKLPAKGQVDLILAGPPCQGFSGMNRPRYLVVENVSNFFKYKKSMILKLTLSCLLRMNYQVAFGVIEAGSYGTPQARKRAIIMAAAPGHPLPQTPQPTHSFSRSQFSAIVDDVKYLSSINGCSGYFRPITVWDSISDLADISEAPSREREQLRYGKKPQSDYQKKMRVKGKDTVNDHVTKTINDLCKARIDQIPCYPGADWRDLPNIRLPLPDGKLINKLSYCYHDRKNGKSSGGNLRGVCSCADGGECDADESRQENTLIPWCLVHTGNRQYQWAGLYGRLQWVGFFATIVTNPEPISKQGRVLHPEQNRIISVRETARAQGFPDHFFFAGNIIERYKQIGNAVPPPLAAALASQIRVSVNGITEGHVLQERDERD